MKIATTRVFIILSIILVHFSCNKTLHLPPSVINFNGKDYVFDNVGYYEGGRSPRASIDGPYSSSWHEKPTELKFSLDFASGHMITGNNILLVSYPREGLREASLMFRRNDTSFVVKEEFYIQGSYSNGIIRYKFDSVRFIAHYFDYVNPGIPTTDTIIASGLIYGYSDR